MKGIRVLTKMFFSGVAPCTARLGSGIALLLAILYRRYRNRMEIAQRLRSIEFNSRV